MSNNLKRLSLSKLIDELGRLTDSTLKAKEAFFAVHAELEKAKEGLTRRASKRGPRKRKKKASSAVLKSLAKARAARSKKCKERRKAKSRR